MKLAALLALLATAIAAALLSRRSKHSLVASTRFVEPYPEYLETGV